MMNFSIKLFEVMNFSSLLNQPVEVTNVGTSSPVFYYVNLNQAPKDNLLQGNTGWELTKLLKANL
jgi:hypothetical protein